VHVVAMTAKLRPQSSQHGQPPLQLAQQQPQIFWPGAPSTTTIKRCIIGRSTPSFLSSRKILFKF
jgi:hypothetical protein